MNIRHALVAAAMLIPVVICPAQATNHRVDLAFAEKNPDADWAALNALLLPPPRIAPGMKRTREEHAAEHAKQVASARLAAKAAKDFYTAHPADPRVPQARKIEAISALRAVTANDPAQESQAVGIAKTFRIDPTMAKPDRLDVAMAMDTQDMNIRFRAGVITNLFHERAKLVELWRSEFGDMPSIDGYAIGVARRADPRTAAALASQVARSPAATSTQKKEARMINERAMLLGKPLKLTVPLADGDDLNLSGQNGHVTIVVVWSPARPESLEPLTAFAGPFPRGTQIICLSLGGNTDAINRIRPTLPAVTRFANVPLGADANRTAKALKLQLAPYVYVINTSGHVSDFGPLDQLPSLLTRAGVTRKKNA